METILVLVFAFLAAVAGCDLPLRWTAARLQVAESGADPPGQCEYFAGEVTAGQGFERSFGDGLLFRLRPSKNAPPNPAGWTIEVREEGNGEHDFVWVATPPYRFWNPRDLTPSYGLSAREVVDRADRGFGFVTGAAEYEALAETVRFLL